MGVRRRRKTIWAVWLWTALCALVLSVQVTGRTPKSCQAGDRVCTYVRDAETRYPTDKLVLVWLLGLMVLTLIWLLTRRERHGCPRCGEDLKKRETKCRLCGYDSAIGVVLAAALSPVKAVPAAPSPSRLELPDLDAVRESPAGALRAPRQLHGSVGQPGDPP